MSQAGCMRLRPMVVPCRALEDGWPEIPCALLTTRESLKGHPVFLGDTKTGRQPRRDLFGWPASIRLDIANVIRRASNTAAKLFLTEIERFAPPVEPTPEWSFLVHSPLPLTGSISCAWMHEIVAG